MDSSHINYQDTKLFYDLDAIERLNDAVFLLGSSTRTIQYCNSAAEKMFGYYASNLTGRTTETLHIEHAYYQQFEIASLYGIDQTGFYHQRLNMQRRNGTVFPTSNILLPTKARDGTSLILSLVRDESKTELSEHSSSLLREIAFCIDQATSLKSALRDVLRILCLHYRWDLGQAWVVDATNQLCKCTTWAAAQAHSDKKILNDNLKAGPEAQRHNIAASVWQTGKSVWISDIENPEFYRSLSTTIGSFKSVFSAPVSDIGKVPAVFVFSNRQARKRSVSIQMSLENVLTLIGPALGNLIRSESAPQISEENLQDLFDGHPLPLWVCEAQSLRVIAANTAALKAEGFTNTAPLRTITERLPGKTLKALKRDIETAIARNESLGPNIFETHNGKRNITTLVPYWSNTDGGPKLILVAIKRRHANQGKSNDISPDSVNSLETTIQSLSLRERQVMECLIEGKLNKEIAHDMGLSERTVEAYRASLKKKLNIKTAAGLIAALLAFGEEPR